jgi:hypothetical protein
MCLHSINRFVYVMETHYKILDSYDCEYEEYHFLGCDAM